jgi:hypothetical protein
MGGVADTLCNHGHADSSNFDNLDWRFGEFCDGQLCRARADLEYTPESYYCLRLYLLYARDSLHRKSLDQWRLCWDSWGHYEGDGYGGYRGSGRVGSGQGRKRRRGCRRINEGRRFGSPVLVAGES